MLLGVPVVFGAPPQTAQSTAGVSQAPVGQDAAPPYHRRAVYEGVAVDVFLKHVNPTGRTTFREGDDVLFRFAVSDTTSGTPITSIYPAAWMDLRPPGEPHNPSLCVKKVENFLGGSMFGRAELDLNVYYVLTLNEDATVTVVDPIFQFGGSKLLELVTLQSPGADWAMNEDETSIFVAMPEANRVAVIETATWSVMANLDAGLRPSRVVIQPDQFYLWVANEGTDAGTAGVSVVAVSTLETVVHIPTGAGPHDITFSDDSRYAFVTNAEAGTLSVIDVRTLTKVKDLATGQQPVSIAYAPIAGAVYVTDETDGTIVAVDAREHRVVARMQAEPGLGQIRFAPESPLGFVVNPTRDRLNIIDASANRILHTENLLEGPDQIAFSDELAYIRHRGEETILMIPLSEIGPEGQPVPVIDFPGGDHPPGRMKRPTPAAGMVPAPGVPAMLISNPEDRGVYFYKEGMAAPMGEWDIPNDRVPRALLVVDRSLQTRSEPGVYETAARLRSPGNYDLVLYLDAPRLAYCVEVVVEEDPQLAQQRAIGPAEVVPLVQSQQVMVGQPLRLPFRLQDAGTRRPHENLTDVEALVFLAPGTWHSRLPVTAAEDGVYLVDFVPPEAGVYYLYLGSESLGLRLVNPDYLILQALDPPSEEEEANDMRR